MSENPQQIYIYELQARGENNHRGAASPPWDKGYHPSRGNPKTINFSKIINFYERGTSFKGSGPCLRRNERKSIANIHILITNQRKKQPPWDSIPPVGQQGQYPPGTPFSPWDNIRCRKMPNGCAENAKCRLFFYVGRKLPKNFE